ncbi:MAG: hypothetical protein DRN81_04920 [Thermoproteota archaeon]|nr:MAG: hypothetical protein DRN81_04920 [Candidatus Korarchaeota archaeon]
MTKDLEELEKEFIMSEDMEHDEIRELIGLVLGICKIDKKGYVVIRRTGLTMQQRIMVVLTARYLANKLQQELERESPIDETCTTMEIANMLKEKDTVVRVRLKELKDDKKVLSPKRGVFRIAPYEIKEFLKELIGQENSKKGGN